MKKFTDRKSAVARIWAAVQRLSPDVAQLTSDVAPAKGEAKKGPAKPAKPARAQKGTKAAKGGSDERSNKKAEVIAMMKAAQGCDAVGDHGRDGLAEAHGTPPREHSRQQGLREN